MLAHESAVEVGTRARTVRLRTPFPLDAFELAGRRPLQNQQGKKERDREQHRVPHLLWQNG